MQKKKTFIVLLVLTVVIAAAVFVYFSEDAATALGLRLLRQKDISVDGDTLMEGLLDQKMKIGTDIPFFDVRQLTANNNSRWPGSGDLGLVVWEEGIEGLMPPQPLTEIYSWQNGQQQNVSNDTGYEDYYPSVWRNEIAWERLDRNTYLQSVMHKGPDHQGVIASQTGIDHVKMGVGGDIAWNQPVGNVKQIFVARKQNSYQPQQITFNDKTSSAPEIECPKVAYLEEDDAGYSQVNIYENGQHRKLSTGYDPIVLGMILKDGVVTWSQRDNGAGDDWDIFMYKDNQIQRITDDNVADDKPDYSQGSLVWAHDQNGQYEIMKRNEAGEISQETNNNVNDYSAKIAGNNLCWLRAQNPDAIYPAAVFCKLENEEYQVSDYGMIGDLEMSGGWLTWKNPNNQNANIYVASIPIDMSLNIRTTNGQEIFHPGDQLGVELDIANRGRTVDADLYVALEYEGHFYFLPEWSRNVQKVDRVIPVGYEEAENIFTVDIPLTTPSLGEVRMYAALVKSGTTELLTGYDMVEFRIE